MQVAKMVLCGVCTLGTVSQIFQLIAMASGQMPSSTMLYARSVLMGIIFGVAALALWKSAFPGRVQR